MYLSIKACGLGATGAIAICSTRLIKKYDGGLLIQGCVIVLQSAFATNNLAALLSHKTVH